MQMKNIVANAVITLVFTTIAPAAHAAVCDAVPYSRLGIDAGGSLFVDFDGAGIINICSITALDRGISKEACAAWYSVLLTNRASRTKVRFYFSTANSVNAGVTSCATLGDWVARAPYFVEAY